MLTDFDLEDVVISLRRKYLRYNVATFYLFVIFRRKRNIDFYMQLSIIWYLSGISLGVSIWNIGIVSFAQI